MPVGTLRPPAALARSSAPWLLVRALALAALVAGPLATAGRAAGEPDEFTPDEAAQIDALRANPLNDEALQGLGDSLAGRAEWKKALDCYTVLSSRHPSQARFDLSRARCLIKLDEPRRATALLRRVIEREPESKDAAALLAQLGADPGPLAPAESAQALSLILEREHCLCHQALIARGLATYNIEKGVAVRLTARKGAKVIADLARLGYLSRAWVPPTSQCQYLSSPDGSVWCAIHGGGAGKGESKDSRASLPRLSRVSIAPQILDDVLARPTASAVVALAQQARQRRQPELAARLSAVLKSVSDAGDLEMAAGDVAQALGGAPEDLRSRIEPPRWLLAAADPGVRLAGAVLLLRLGRQPEIGPSEAVGLIQRASEGLLDSVELDRALAHAGPTVRARLATYVRTMPLAQAPAAIPALAKLGDKPILLALARKLDAYEGPAQMARPLLLDALRKATGADAGEDSVHWVKRIEASGRGR